MASKRSMKSLTVAICAALATLSAPLHAQVPVPDGIVAKALAGVAVPVAKSVPKTNAPVSPALLDIAEESAAKDWRPDPGRTVSKGVLLDAGLAHVRIEVSASNPSALRDRVTTLGGHIDVEHEGALYARIPPRAVSELADDRQVKSLVPQGVYDSTARLSTGEVGEGIAMTRVRALHEAGLSGRGIKIGVLDVGFAGVDDLVRRGELPKSVTLEVFSAREGRMSSVHGTACAEIIHDMAPEATLLLAQAGPGDGRASDGEIIAAARWLKSRGANIISASVGGIASAQDGSAELDRMVDAMTADGILWVIAAGNEGEKHWGARVRDANRNGWVDVPESPGVDALIFDVRRDGPVQLFVKWSDWLGQAEAGNPQDIDFVLLRVLPDGRAEAVHEAVRPRSAIEVPPLEIASGTLSAGTYALMMRGSRVTRDMNVHVFLNGATFRNGGQPAGSMASPGTAREALTVGAVHARTGALEGYSSQGPTDDARVKPDVVAPASMRSVAYNGAFPGTSAATPHVAGFAALLLQAQPGASAKQLKQQVAQTVRVLDAAAPSNRTGHGLIDGERRQQGNTSGGAPGSGAGDAAPGRGARDMLRQFDDLRRKP
jgi:subtilisin family serine protease